MTKSLFFSSSSCVSRRCVSSLILISVLFSNNSAFAQAASISSYVHVRSNQLAVADTTGVLDTFEGFILPTRAEGTEKKVPEAKKIYTVDSTAYTSSVEECDNDPFTTADGSTTRDGIIAANFLPFGTKVRIPELFGDKVFEVHDRMNARYWYRVDVWMEKKVDMRQYGIHRNVKIEIVEMGDGKTQWKKLAKTN